MSQKFAAVHNFTIGADRIRLLKESASAIYAMALSFGWVIDTELVNEEQRIAMEELLDHSLDLVHKIHEVI